MVGRMTATVNANGDICAIQKAGGGVSQRVIMQCLHLATTKAAAITKQIKEAVSIFSPGRPLKLEGKCFLTAHFICWAYYYNLLLSLQNFQMIFENVRNMLLNYNLWY